MSVTAVPLRPIRKRSLVILWTGLGLLIAGGVGLAIYSQRAFAQEYGRTSAGLLATNAKRKGVVTTASGLQYEILTPADGPKPVASDIAIIEYEGRLADGEVFDASARNGGPVPMPVSGTIPGFSEGLQLMNTGAKYRFWMPPELAYGEQGTPGGPIPPNAALVFDVTLVAAAPPAAFGMGAPGGMPGMGGAPGGQ